MVGIGVSDAGRTCWEVGLSDPGDGDHFPSTATIDGQFVLFASDGDVDAVDLSGGHLAWRWSAGLETVSVLAADGGEVVVAVRPTSYGATSKPGSPTELVGLDEGDGKLRWRDGFSAGQAPEFAASGDGGVVVTGEFDGPEEVVDDDNGSVRWRATVISGRSGPGVPSLTRIATMGPPVGDEILQYDLATNQTVAVSTRTGATLWRTPAGSSLVPAEAADGVILCDRDPGTVPGATSVLDPTTGRVIWSVKGAAASGFSDVGGALVEVSNRGVERFDPSTGRSEWFAAVPGGSAVGIGGLLVVDDPESAQAVALDLVTGGARWRAPLPGYAAIAATAGPGGMVVASSGSTLVGLEPATGSEVWTAQLPEGTQLDGSEVTPVGGGVVVSAVTPAAVFVPQ